MASKTKTPDYPAHISFMVSDEMRAYVDAVAEEDGEFISEVVRELLALGIAARVAGLDVEGIADAAAIRRAHALD